MNRAFSVAASLEFYLSPARHAKYVGPTTSANGLQEVANCDRKNPSPNSGRWIPTEFAGRARSNLLIGYFRSRVSQCEDPLTYLYFNHLYR
jgi:hypothetical protein